MSFETLEPEDFAYDTEVSMNPSESLFSYYPGGFHPVALGKVVSSAKTRYHIVHKLGWGGYATVWLVQDLKSHAWCALRIRMSDSGCEGEDDVLGLLRAMPRSPHLPTIFDIFTINGPNGRHSAIVTDVIAPLSATLPHLSSERVDMKAIVRGIVEAVVVLHDASVVHGDLHIGNVGLAVSIRTHEIPLRCPVLAQPEVTFVIAQSARALALSSHFPSYLVSPINIGSWYERLRDANESHVIKVFDFGNAHLDKKPRPAGGFMSSIAPPEWEIAQTLEQKPDIVFNTASDVWALGLLIYSVLSGGRSLLPRHSDQLLEMVKLAGGVPTSWNSNPGVKRYNRHEITPQGAEALWQQQRTFLRGACSSDEDADALIALLRRILVLDPAARPSAADILRDPWFSIARKSLDPGGVRGTTHPRAQSTGPALSNASPTPQSVYPSTNPYSIHHIAMHPGQYGAFHPQTQYPPPPSVNPAPYAHPFNPHTNSYTATNNRGFSPYPAHVHQLPMGAGAWTPRA